MKSTNTLYVFAAAAALALSSCKDSKPEGNTTDMDMTSDSVKSEKSDMGSTKDTTAINPDTIMGP
ncbi:hypothetical protein AAEO56_02545 [Flavobacterium sp. DGU11]|uniref:Cytochrome C551 n=1 Tax=Flavobacterium arundinis TaxID=3139143 RepID=A0ABU9HTU3_9FLAO